ncbi:MAG: hypothetical protein ACXACY_17785, partial [Candidatus Hodarchaeales archaeon]
MGGDVTLFITLLDIFFDNLFTHNLITLKTRFSNYNVKISAAAFVISLLTALLYLPALQNNFVNWDDQYYVYEN